MGYGLFHWYKWLQHKIRVTFNFPECHCIYKFYCACSAEYLWGEIVVQRKACTLPYTSQRSSCVEVLRNSVTL